MRLHMKKVFATVAFSLVALPIWAARVDTVDWETSQPMAVGTTQLKAGQYQLRAEEGKSELQVIQKGKVIATVPCQWVQLPAKAASSEVETDATKVTQIQFAGRTGALQFNQ